MKKAIPFIKEGLVICGIMTTGDVLCQTLVEKVAFKDLDSKRTMKFGAIGLCLIGPGLHFWFRKLDKLVSPHQPPFKRAIKKMVLDQTFVAPTYMFTITCLTGVLNGKSGGQIKHLLQNEFLEMLKTNYMIWPFVQTFNFALVPIAYQVIFAQVIAIFWNAYLSYLINKDKNT